MEEFIISNVTLDLNNGKSNLDAVLGLTNPLSIPSDTKSSVGSVSNLVTASNLATPLDISTNTPGSTNDAINTIILPLSSISQTSISSSNATSKSSTAVIETDLLTGITVNESLVDNSKPDLLTNPSASQTQTLPDILPDIKTNILNTSESGASVSLIAEESQINTDSTSNDDEQAKENVRITTDQFNNTEASITANENVAIASTSNITDSSQTPTNTNVTAANSSTSPLIFTENKTLVDSTSSIVTPDDVTATTTKDSGINSPITSSINSTTVDVTKTNTTTTNAQNITQLISPSFSFNTGVFKVDETGTVGIDYLFDGGGYEGELGIFSLEGMEELAQNSDAFITEAARRSVSNSNLGYVVINDATEGARFSGVLPYDTNHNKGEYQGVKTFTMRPGDTFGVILVPNRATLQQVANNSAIGDDMRPLFSLPMANPNGSLMTGQIADVTGIGNTFVMEDLRVDKSGTDSDYNDIIFQVRGATGSAVSIDSVIDLNKDWRPTNLGKALIEYAKPYVTPENPKVGELVTDELYDSIFGNKDNQVDNNSKTGAIAPEVPKSDTPVVTTAPATDVTSTNSGAIAPPTEKPSVSVVEASPVTNKTAVTAESEDKAIAPQDVSTTPVSPQQPVVTTEPSSSVTASDAAPKNPDSTVVIDNNSEAIAPVVTQQESPVIDILSVTSSSSNYTNTGQVTETQNQSSVVVVETVVVTDAMETNTGEEQAIVTDKPLPENNVGAISPTTEANTQPTVAQTVASQGEGEGAISSTTPVTVTQPVVTLQTVVNEWLEKANSQLTQLETTGEQKLQSLQNELIDAGNSIYNQVPDIWSNLSTNENYMNAWVNALGNQITSSADYLNAWANYLQDKISSTSNSTYTQSWDIWQNLSSNTDYLNSWDNYLNSELSGVGKYMYDWANYSASEINRVRDWMYGWTNYNWNEIVRIENWMIDRTNHVVNEFNQYGVGDAAWNEYNALRNNRNSIVNTAETQYYDNVFDRNIVQDTANSNFRAWDDYRIGVMNDAWEEYNNFDSYTDAVINNAWNDYRNLDNYRVQVMDRAWSDYNSLKNYQANIIGDAWIEYYALNNYTDAVMADAWNQYQAQNSNRYQIMGDAWTQYSASTNSWNDSVDDTQAQIDVWAKIATSEGRWYNTPSNTKSGLPLIGIIDTGFSAENPDIDYSRITLGKDLVGGDDNPLLESGEWWQDDHGTKILEIIGATRNNNIGIDGINDRSPLWLGGAVGSNDWAQSLVEFVDAAKASGQPNAVVNLSFDLTETLPDGSVVTRHELTALERAALTYAQQNNVLVVAATGNQNALMSALGEATKEFDNILVAGAAEGWQRADYSSYGEVDYANYGKGVDILAQGTATNGAVGSSVAAAKVTGAASLIWAANPNLNYTQVMDILRRTATDLNAPGWDTQTGLGLLNIAAAVHLAKATQPETYKPANFDLVEDTLKTYGIPEVYWKDFYNLYYYYDLEAKMTGAAWTGTASAIATERAAWSWKDAAIGAGIGGAVFGVTGALVGAVAGGLLGNSGGGSGSGSSDPFPQWAKNLVSSTKTSLNSAKSVLIQVATDTKKALKNAEAYLGQVNSKLGSEIDSAANYVRDQFNDAWSFVSSAATSIGSAVDNGWNNFVNAADYVRNTAAATWDATRKTANSVTAWVTNAWNESSNAVNSVQNSLEKGWNAISKVAQQVGDKIPKSIDELKKLGKDVNDFLNKNNPVGKLASDLAAKLKSNLEGINVGAVLDALKKIPVAGTVVNGIEGLIALIQGDWKQVAKNGINGVLDLIPGGSAVPEKVVNILVDVGWGIISKDYKTALKDVLKELEVKDKVANTFVDVAWAMKDGEWKSVLGTGLSSTGFNNADKFVSIAWGMKDGDYTKALTAGIEVAGLDKLSINSNQAKAFVNSAIALKDNLTSNVADELLSVAGTQFANSSWVRDLKDGNPNNDRAAVTQGLSASGFKNVEQWVNMAWDVKDKKYLDAISTGFSLAKFSQGTDWVNMAWSLQQGDYLKALSTGFKVAGFPEGEHLAKAAVNLREGKYLDAFFEGMYMVPGVGDLVNAFKAVGDGNFKGVANSLAKVATNPTLLQLLVS